MRRQTFTTVFVAALLVLSAGFATAAVTYDTETTNTATTSDVSSSSTVFQYNATDDIKLEFETQGTESAIEVTHPETNETLLYRNVTDQSVSQTYSDTATSPSTYYWVTNFSQSNVDDIEVAAGGNITLTTTIINDTRATNPTTREVNITIENDDKRTFVKLEDSEVGDSGVATLVSEQFAGLSIPFLSQDAATLEDSVDINGSGTTATYAIANSTVADRLDASAEDASDGEWVMSTLLTVDDTPTKVYKNEAADDVDNSSTYAVWDASADELRVHYGDDYSDSSSTDITVDANRGLLDQIGTYGVFDVASAGGPFAGLV